MTIWKNAVVAICDDRVHVEEGVVGKKERAKEMQQTRSIDAANKKRRFKLMSRNAHA